MRDRLDEIIDRAQQAALDAGACGDAIAIDDARKAAVKAIADIFAPDIIKFAWRAKRWKAAAKAIKKEYSIYPRPGCHDVEEFYRDVPEPVGPKPPQPPVVRGNEIDADETPERML